MKVKHLPDVNGAARAEIDGRIYVRAIDVSRVELPGDDDLGSSIRSIFKRDHPGVVISAPSGHGLSTGHYIYETHLGELVAYHKDAAVIQKARENTALGRGHGAGVKKGKSSQEIAFSTVVDGEIINFSGTVIQLKDQFEDLLTNLNRVILELDAERGKVRSLTVQRDKALDDIRDLLDKESARLRLQARAGVVVPFVPAPAPTPAPTPARSLVAKPRVRSINGVLVPVGEVWKCIETLPLFEVSNFGRFRKIGSTGRFVSVIASDRLSYVPLWRMVSGKRVSVYANAALLVADAFCPHKIGPYLSFKDRNTRNLHADNLEWLTKNSPKRHDTDVRPRANRSQELAA